MDYISRYQAEAVHAHSIAISCRTGENDIGMSSLSLIEGELRGIRFRLFIYVIHDLTQYATALAVWRARCGDISLVSRV